MTTDPDQARASHATRRAKKYGIKGAYTAQQWRLALSVYGGARCLCCGADDKPLAADHVIPLSRGGRNTISNIQPLCMECDQRKAARVMDYRPLDKILTLRRVLKHCAAQAAQARAARLARIECLYAWCWFAAQAHNRSFTMSNTDQTTPAAGSTSAPRFDHPITSMADLAADLDTKGIDYDDDSLGALFAAVGNTPGYVVPLHMGFEWLCQLRAVITMGALVLGWRGCDDLAVYVEEQMSAAGVDFSRDLPSAEHIRRAAPLVAAGMGPIDAYWQAVEDWEDENLVATADQLQIRENIREDVKESRRRKASASE